MNMSKRIVMALFAFGVALYISIAFPDLVDNKNAYDDDIREFYEPFLYTKLNVTKHIASNFYKSSYGKKKFIKEYLHETPPPAEDVFDTRTKAANDLYEALHLIRVPGRHAIMEAKRVEAELLLDRAKAREEETLQQLQQQQQQQQHRHYRSTFATSFHDVTSEEEEEELFETNSVQLVKHTVATSANPTRKGGQTSINYDDLYNIIAQHLDKVSYERKRNELHLFNLPRVKAKRQPTHGWQKFYIALNLFNNEDVLPFLTAALVAFIEDELAPFFDITTSVVVSIYANASPDLTAPLIRSFLVPYLQHIGVRTIFVTTNGACGGYLSRQ